MSERIPRPITDERPVESSAGRAFWTVLATLQNVLGFKQVGLQLLNEFGTNMGYWVTSQQWKALDEGVGEPEWLIFGDSTAITGIVPEVFDETLEATSRNFATFANLLVVNDAWMLGEYIRQHGPPKNVLLVHTMDIWHRVWRAEVVAKVPRRFGFWERIEPTLDLEWHSKWKVIKGQYFPLYAESATAAKVLKRPWLVGERWFRMTPGGHVPGRPHDEARVVRDLARARKLVKGGRFRMSRANREALQTICHLAAAWKFDVYLAWGPSHEAMEVDEAYQAYHRRVGRELGRLADGCPRLTFIPQQFYFPNEAVDVHIDHLTPQYAPEYTHRLARALRQTIAGREE